MLRSPKNTVPLQFQSSAFTFLFFCVLTGFLLAPQVSFAASLKIINASERLNNFRFCGDLFLTSETDTGLHGGLNNLSTVIL